MSAVDPASNKVAAGAAAANAAQPAPEVRTVKGYSLPGEGSSTVISIVSIASLFALWWVATHFGWIRDIFLPTPEKGLHQFRRRVEGRHPGRQAAARALSGGACIACSPRSCSPSFTAVPVGIAMGVSRIMRGIFDPPIEFYRPLPPLRYLPLIVIWFGIEETAKVILIYLACFAPLAMARAPASGRWRSSRSTPRTRWAPRNGR
jgi:taurine transport system permease protein